MVNTSITIDTIYIQDRVHLEIRNIMSRILKVDLSMFGDDWMEVANILISSNCSSKAIKTMELLYGKI